MSKGKIYNVLLAFRIPAKLSRNAMRCILNTKSSRFKVHHYKYSCIILNFSQNMVARCPCTISRSVQFFISFIFPFDEKYVVRVNVLNSNFGFDRYAILKLCMKQYNYYSKHKILVVH